MSVLSVRRENAQLLQSEVAAQMNIDRSTIAKWEAGKSMPRADKLPVLAKLYGCTIDQLFSGEEKTEAVVR